MLKKILKWVGIVLGVLIIAAITLFMIYVRPFMQKNENDKHDSI